jgi:NAD(P)H-hydrate epimerase
MYELSRIPTTAQLRALEAAWIKACHSDWGMVLMEVAGLHAARHAELFLKGNVVTPGPVVIVCGRGNNGGDGLVVARHLQRQHVPLSIYMIGGGKDASARSESTINKKIIEESAGLTIHYFDEDSLEALEEAIDRCSLIVDALLGTGLDRPVKGAYAEAIAIINSSGKPVLSIDIPSGIDSDRGQIMGDAVAADITVTFGYLKAGLLHYPGAQHAGVIRIVDIGLPSINMPPPALDDLSAQLASPQWWLATHAQVRNWLPYRPPDGHKGTFGKVLAVAGSLGMSGAPMLACRTVLRSGAGYVVLATPRVVVEHLPPEEIVYFPLTGTKSGAIDPSSFEQLEEQLAEAQAVLVGPGLGSEKATVDLVERLLTQIDKPCIVDADGLNAISKIKGLKLKTAENFVFTPHPKELERLTGTKVAEIQSDRVAAATAACEKFGCNIVLKGAHTVVATPNEGVYIIPTGNSGMATPGAGDVLSGVIAAFLAQGMHPSYAAVAGAYVHGAAGDCAADLLGEDGVIASDIMQFVSHVIAEIRDGQMSGRDIEQEVLGLCELPEQNGQ